MDNIIITKIIKTGNSLCVVIPTSLRKALSFQRGDYVILQPTAENTLSARKLSSKEIQQIKLGPAITF